MESSSFNSKYEDLKKENNDMKTRISLLEKKLIKHQKELLLLYKVLLKI